MDFYQIKERSVKNGVIEIYPDFKVCRSKDLMVRGKSFYAIWDEERQLWSTDEYDVQRIVDADLMAHREKVALKNDGSIVVKLLSDFSTKSWSEFRNYVNHISDNSKQLDSELMFSNTEIKKKDYASKKLPYPLEKGDCEEFKELIGTLYDPAERTKLEWAIGSIVAGEAKTIQKFLVLYGEAGAGKSTILNIIQSLFEGYYTTFEAKALTASSNAFATEVFKGNPLVALQHDGDLSRIEDNTKLNSIVSHEEMTMNEKYKPSYMARINCFLFMATNRPVKITDAKSGVIRRLIDVRPSGRKVSPKRYQALMTKIGFQLGPIAHHCLSIYRKLGKNYYNGYRPLNMILQTDVFFNFVESQYHLFKEQDGVSLKQAYDLYKVYCEEALVEYKIARHKFREELKNYFKDFSDIARVDGAQVRSYYSGFSVDKFKTVLEKEVEEHQTSIVLDSKKSLLDKIAKKYKAQYATRSGTPKDKWDDVKTKLSDLDSKKIHYLKLPENHIVIDFDLKDDDGKKSLEKNLEAASKFPPTYTELSKSGGGVHLHYIYDGDVKLLSRVYSEGIEIKVFTGNSSLRRKLSKCNKIPITTINSGLPTKGEKMINFDNAISERGIRDLIKRNLNKEVHPGTKPSMDFMYKILEDAYDSGVVYDIIDMRPKIMAFAANSSNQADYCLKLISKMKFQSEEKDTPVKIDNSDDTLVFFDVEVFPNLFVVVWKKEGAKPVTMINPKSQEIEELFKFNLVGFNCRRYDNHILYARYLGYTNEQLYEASQRIISNSKNAMFREAYNISYTDIYEFSSKKQSLKKFEIELGIHHQELGLPWDQPVSKSLWEKVAEYCINDVVATEATFNARKADFMARKILSELSGLSMNDTTQRHAAKILFGEERNPQKQFVYTDLSEMFPGYKYSFGKSIYKDVEVGEGGYVYAEPGIYHSVALLDIASMHPTSLIQLNAFGPYTERFEEVVQARLAVKHKDYDRAESLLSGILKPYLGKDDDNLSYALKIVINIVYGMTSAKFDNPFKDPKNIDNIVAKRGSLFMVDLLEAVKTQGYKVAHIKTDSIKIPNATPEIIEFVHEFGSKYGYVFEHEATYEKMCLVNDAVYIAKYDGQWSATGAQFAHPYVFKTLFSKEPIELEDLCETKAVTSALYLDMNENIDDIVGDVDIIIPSIEKELKKRSTGKGKLNPEYESHDDEMLKEILNRCHDYKFVGKVGSFCPILPGHGGGVLYREKDGKFYAATGSKGYRWLETEVVKELGMEDKIDKNFHRALADDAIDNISKYGDFEAFVSDDNDVPWKE